MFSEFEATGTVEGNLPVRRHDGYASIRPVRGDHGRDAGRCVGVESHRRLVEEPERRRRRQQARESEPPSLPR